MEQFRKVIDEAEARECLAAAEAAGVVAREWARARGIDARSLNAWRINLSRGGADEKRKAKRATRRPRLIELVPAAASSTLTARYVVRVGGCAVELGDDFDDATLRRVIAVLRSC